MTAHKTNAGQHYLEGRDPAYGRVYRRGAGLAGRAAPSPGSCPRSCPLWWLLPEVELGLGYVVWSITTKDWLEMGGSSH